MPYQSYTVSRFIGDDAEHGTTFTVADDDAINCAHMLAAGFNTMSRNMLGDFVLAVVDMKARTVTYDGKVEKIERVDPWSISQSFTFEPSDADTIVSLFGNGEMPTFTAAGKFTFAEPSKYAHFNRDVLEAGYAELQDVKDVLSDAGTETIPATAGVQELTRRLEFERSARQAQETRHAEANEAARAEMISFVKRAHAKKVKLQSAVPDGDGRPELDDRWRGMLDVLAKFLVVTGEADSDEGHAVARKLCGVDADEF